MNNDQSKFRKGRTVVSGVTAGMVLIALSGCSGKEPKPMVQPTPDQVRSHSERGFDKLKQEEQERAAQPPVTR